MPHIPSSLRTANRQHDLPITEDTTSKQYHARQIQTTLIPNKYLLSIDKVSSVNTKYPSQ